MRIRALATFRNDRRVGLVRRGEIRQVADGYGTELIRRGLAEQVERVPPPTDEARLPERFATPTDSAPAPRYEVGTKTANGWWPVIDTEAGEQVDGESERSEEAAQANADRLNERVTTDTA